MIDYRISEEIENYHDLYQNLNLSDDFLFGKVMQDKEILKALLENILGFSINKIEMVHSQKVIEIDPAAHGIRMDIYADDGENTRYSVEMQKSNNYNIPKRSRYYLSAMDLDQLEKGADYNDLKKSFLVFICLFDPFGKGFQKYTFERVCTEDNEILLRDESTIVVLTDSVNENSNEELEAFFSYIVNSTSEMAENTDSGLVKMIHKRVVEVKNNRNLEVEFLHLIEREREYFKAGKQEGREEGRQEGVAEQQRAVVKKMLSRGMSDEDICDIAGCSQEFIDNIRKIIE